jgi:hypothetical protein
MVLVKRFGLHWPRNQENLDEIEDLAGHKSGIYVLYQVAAPSREINDVAPPKLAPGRSRR